MTTPTEAVYAVLSSFAGVQALVANGTSPETYRIYAILMPQEPVMPAITFQRISGEREALMADGGGNGVERSRIRVTSWARTVSESQAIAEQVRLAMKAATTFDTVHLVDLDAFEDDTQLYSVTTDYAVWYKY